MLILSGDSNRGGLDTGHAKARERSHAAGFDQHLAKPVDLRTLQDLLETLQT